MRSSTATSQPTAGPADELAGEPEPQGVRQRAAQDLRERLLAAATAEFAEHGFDGASTRAIAARAGAHQPQINYHFSSKAELWRAVVDQLITDLDEQFSRLGAGDPRELMAGAIRVLVHFAAERPELQRIMIQEGTAPSDRLDWIVDTHLRPRHAFLVALWDDVAAQGRAAPVPPVLLHHLLIGGATLLYANAPEARRLLGIEPTDPALVDQHAETLVALLLPTPEETSP